MTTLTGLLRDLVVAVFGVLLIFGISSSQEQVAAVVALVAAGLAFGTWLYKALNTSTWNHVSGIGLFRDAAAAGLAVAVLYGVTLSQEQVGAVLVLVTTIAAAAQWGITAAQAKKAPAPPGALP